MEIDPDLAAIRFGCGLSPRHDPPDTLAGLLRGRDGPDRTAQAHPMQMPIPLVRYFKDLQEARANQRDAKTTAQAVAAREVSQGLQKAGRHMQARHLAVTLTRWVDTRDALRERLVHFWADHFTVEPKGGHWRPATALHREDTIRPNIAARFEALLAAAVTHPVMLVYLDQAQSIGENSLAARRNPGRGLNENLAREVLELHTLGVGGPYDQDDVRALAGLLTGLGVDRTGQRVFRPSRAQVGRFTLLGKTYARDGGMEVLADVFRDLARHPATAQHLARKLAVHFVADQPDPALVAHVAARFRQTDGDLRAVTEALLEHPAAWAPGLRNIKPPFAFVGSALRALDAQGRVTQTLADMPLKQIAGRVARPLQQMGQGWQAPGGPDGWPEADSAWLTPSGLTTRARWAFAVARQMGKAVPDPRAFVTQALGGQADGSVAFAAGAAETRAEGVGLVLLSPSFQSR